MKKCVNTHFLTSLAKIGHIHNNFFRYCWIIMLCVKHNMQTSSEMMQNNMLLIKGQNVIHLSFFCFIKCLKITKAQLSLHLCQVRSVPL